MKAVLRTNTSILLEESLSLPSYFYPACLSIRFPILDVGSSGDACVIFWLGRRSLRSENDRLFCLRNDDNQDLPRWHAFVRNVWRRGTESLPSPAGVLKAFVLLACVAFFRSRFAQESLIVEWENFILRFFLSLISSFKVCVPPVSGMSVKPCLRARPYLFPPSLLSSRAEQSSVSQSLRNPPTARRATRF